MLTPHGEVSIESLRDGDGVVSYSNHYNAMIGVRKGKSVTCTSLLIVAPNICQEAHGFSPDIEVLIARKPGQQCPQAIGGGVHYPKRA